MGVKVTNNAFGTLSAAINSTATTITVDSGQGGRFPSLGAGDYFYATLVNTANNLEIVKVTARSADSMTAVRGQDGTTALSFAIGDRIELRPVAALFEDIIDGAEVLTDTTPQLGGDLDLNSNDITGTGGIDITGKAILGSGVDLPEGHVGFNRNITNGNIYSSASSAFQFSWYNNAHSTQNTLALETYLGNGSGVGNAFEVTTNNANSKGIFYKPTQPRFVAVDGRNQGQQAIANINISQYFTTAVTNNGGYYNTSNGRFTAPMAGFYIFGWNFFTTGYSSDTSSRTGIILNGSTTVWSGGDRIGHANQGSICIQLAQGDYINLGTQGGSYTAYWYSGNFHSRFWGYLVG